MLERFVVEFAPVGRFGDERVESRVSLRLEDRGFRSLVLVPADRVPVETGGCQLNDEGLLAGAGRSGEGAVDEFAA